MNRFSDAVRRFCLRAEQNPAPAEWKLRKHWLVMLLGVIAAPCIALALGQDCTFDVLNYHFYSGYALLAKPLQYDFAPAQVQSFFNPLMHVLSYLLLAHLPSIPAAVVLAVLQGLNFYLVFQIAQILFRKWPEPFRFLISLCSAVTGCYSSIFILELGTTFGDSLCSLFVLSGLLLIFSYFNADGDETPPSNRRLGIAGAILGAVLGLKITVAIYVAAIAAAVLAVLLRAPRRIRPLFVFFAFMGLSFVAAYGFWGYSLYHEYQSPIFPYMNRIFRSPFYALANLSDARFFARNWQQRFFYPFFFARKNSLVSEIAFRDIRLAFCYVAVVALAATGVARFVSNLARSRNKPAGRAEARSNILLLALFFSISYLLWQNQFSVYRYLIVLELLAPAFLALVLARFVKRRLVVFLGSLAVNIIICRVMIPADFGRQKFDDDFLKVDIPAFEDLDKSVVLMTGLEPTSFIVPHFPASTRFVRISSNFYSPGQNVRMDNKIRGILSQYDARHTLVFIAEGQDSDSMRRQLGFYGVKVDGQSCRPLLRRAGDVGYLCGVPIGGETARDIPAQTSSAEIAMTESPAVRLEISPKVATEGTAVDMHLSGLNSSAIDLLVTINGEPQPPQKRFFLDRDQTVRFPVSSKTPRGLYHIIGVRNSAAPASDPWIKVDARLLIR